MYTKIQAIGFCILVACSYVGAIHIGTPTSIRHKQRNDPDVIHYRMRRIGVLCGAMVVVVPFGLKYLHAYSSYGTIIRTLGVVPGYTNLGGFGVDVMNVCRSVGLISVLYAGPILEYFVDIDFDAATLKDGFHDAFLLVWGVRDHLFAPVTEELIYRSTILAFLQPFDSISRAHKVTLTPLFFGIAHVHHGYDLFTYGGADLQTVAFTVLFQTTYTTIFGMLCNHVFLRSNNNLWCPVAVHAICNLMGFPKTSIGGPLAWRLAYYMLLVIGIYGFARLL